VARFLVLVLAALAFSGPAAAWAPTPRQEAHGGAGYAEVTPHGGPRSGVIHGFIDIPAPAERIWRLMLDCAEAPKMVSFVKSCRVLQRDSAGAWDVREDVIEYGFPFPRVHSVFRSDYEPPSRIRFHCLPSGDLKDCAGEWRLEPRGGSVRVVYENQLTAPFSAPAFIVRPMMRHDVLMALRALKRLAVAG
jgi:hypothetical protein